MDANPGLIGLSRLSGLLIRTQDPIGVVTSGLVEACRSAGADAGGLLVRSGDGAIEVLAATSHRAADLEIYQAAAADGPCVDAMREARCLLVDSSRTADLRWPGFGVRMVRAGYMRVCSVPMLWQGDAIGALNLFWTGPGWEAVDESLVQTFADILTLAVLHVRPMTEDGATRRLQEMLEARTVIEQAKGVLAWEQDLDMIESYAELVRIADERNITVGTAADEVVAGARRKQAPPP